MTQENNTAVPVRAVTGRNIISTNIAVKVIAAEDGALERDGFPRPIIIVGPGDLIGSGGRYVLEAGEPMRVVLKAGDGTTIDGPAMPVYAVDVDGNHDASFGS